MMSTNATRVSWAIAMSISSCVFALKIFTRLKFVGGLKPDDYLATAAFLCLLVSSVFTFLMLDLGLQNNLKSDIDFIKYLAQGYTIAQFERMLEYFFICDQLYIWGILFNKLSLIFLYKRITRSAATLKRLNLFLTGLAIFCVAFSTALFIADFAWCKPLDGFWKFKPKPQAPENCSKRFINTTIYVWQGFNVSTDLLIMFIPYFLLSAAALPHRTQRLALYFLFSLSILVVVSSIVKIVGIARNFEPYSLILWSIIEGNVAMCVACLPSLPPLIWRTARMSSSTTPSRSRRSRSYKGGTHNSDDTHTRTRSLRNSFGLVRREMLHLHLIGGIHVGNRGREELSIVEIDTARRERDMFEMKKLEDLELGRSETDDNISSSASVEYEDSVEDSIRHHHAPFASSGLTGVGGSIEEFDRRD